jgi:2-polyprenyl-3-methyl-5-hydroxy-6-metoxy-1,4-benzoquinol methylase
MQTRLQTKKRWDEIFKLGEWDYLKGPKERPRYLIISAYANNFKKKNPVILDVCCGEGILIKMLKFSKYLGTDISQIAINKAKKINKKNITLRCIDARTYRTDKKFDIIIFNEFLYYLKEKEYQILLKKYCTYLKEGGIFIISTFSKEPSTKAIWKYLKKNFTLIDYVLITNRYGTSWRVGTLTKKRTN